MTTGCCDFSSCSTSSLQPIPKRSRRYPRQREAGWNEHKTMLCHQYQLRIVRPQRASLRQHRCSSVKTQKWDSLHSLMFAVLLSVLLCTHGVSASNIHSGHRAGELLFDKRQPPLPRVRIRAAEDLSLGFSQHVARDHHAGTSYDQSITTDTSTPPGPPLPMPFDSSLGSNFTSSSCPAFFNSFLTEPSFKACLPFSLLLQVRQSRSSSH